MIKIIEKNSYLFLILFFFWFANFFLIGKFLTPIKIFQILSLKNFNNILGNLSILIFIINIFFLFILIKKKKN